MSFYGITVRDQLGILGTASSDVLGRLIYSGTPNPPVSLPDFDSNAPCIILYALVGAARQWILTTPAVAGWNNTTKVLSNLAPVAIFAFGGTLAIPSGEYGISIRNSDGQVIISSFQRNLEIVAHGTINVTSARQIHEITYPEVDEPLLWVQMPNDVYIYCGAPLDDRVAVSAETATSFKYFVTGQRKNAAGLPSGYHTTIYDPAGRVVFSSARAYARIIGCYSFAPYEFVSAVAGPGGAVVDFQLQYNQAPATSFVCLNARMRDNRTGTSDYIWPIKKVRLGGYDYFRHFRFFDTITWSSTVRLGYNGDTNTNIALRFHMIAADPGL